MSYCSATGIQEIYTIKCKFRSIKTCQMFSYYLQIRGSVLDEKLHSVQAFAG
jgi:hypothetical protein